MENERITITYKTSEDLESKMAGDGKLYTTTIIFKDWTDLDYKVAAAETVKIRQMQPRIRKGQVIGSEFVAARPGTRGSVQIDAHAALVKGFGEVKAKELEVKFGNAEAAFERLKALLEE